MRFRLFNIPVYVHPSFWIFVLVFAGLHRGPSIESVILALVLFISLLVHELGHAVTAAYYGANPSIFLEAFGGTAQYDAEKLSAKQQFWVTLNGPLLESLLVLVSYGLLKSGLYAEDPYVGYTLNITMYLNILWCLFNLLPVLPLDGGRLLLHVLERKWGETGVKASAYVGVISTIFCVPVLYWQGWIFFSLFLCICAWRNWQTLRSLSLTREKCSPFTEYMRGVEALNRGELEVSRGIFHHLLKSADLQVRHSAIESLAGIYYREGTWQKAYDILLRADPEMLLEGKCLLCKLAFKKANYDLVTKYARDIYTIEPTREVASMIAEACRKLSQDALADAWQITAEQFATTDIEESLPV